MKRNDKVIKPKKYAKKILQSFLFDLILIQIASLSKTILVPNKQNSCNNHVEEKSTSTEEN